MIEASIAHTKEIFPGEGGYLRFLPQGAILFIPKLILETWEGIEIVTEKNQIFLKNTAKS
jgi:hypothetical protein